MNYELRILNGLHRGAALPLEQDLRDAGMLEIGASDDAGVVLVDPGMAARHARVSASDGGWLIEALDGELFSVEDSRPQRLVELQPGDFARIGDVWITIVPDNAAWTAAPAAAAATFKQDSDDVAAPADEAAVEAEEQAADAGAAQLHHERPVPAPARGSRLRRLLFAPFAVVIVLSGAGAYAISRSPEAPDTAQGNAAGELKKLGQPISRIAPKEQTPGEDQADQPADKSVAASGAPLPPPLNGSQLQSAFRKRLSDAQLLPRMDLKLEENNWTVRGDLDEVETARFQRVLKGFLEENQVHFPVDAKIVSAATMLPFEIRQVITGSNASVVTADGARIFVGDEYKGVKLVSMKGNNLVFAGKRKFEVTW